MWFAPVFFPLLVAVVVLCHVARLEVSRRASPLRASVGSGRSPSPPVARRVPSADARFGK